MKNQTALQVRWRAMAPREQSLVLAACAMVVLALLWWVAISPATATLRTAASRQAALDTQLQHMQTLQAEAQQLLSVSQRSPGDPVGALRTALTKELGNSGQLNVVGDRITLTLKAAPADGLAQWLAQARSNSRTSPIEARLTRASAGAAPNTPASADAPLRWDGTVVLALPPALASAR